MLITDLLFSRLLLLSGCLQQRTYQVVRSILVEANQSHNLHNIMSEDANNSQYSERAISSDNEATIMLEKENTFPLGSMYCKKYSWIRQGSFRTPAKNGAFRFLCAKFYKLPSVGSSKNRRDGIIFGEHYNQQMRYSLSKSCNYPISYLRMRFGHQHDNRL